MTIWQNCSQWDPTVPLTGITTKIRRRCAQSRICLSEPYDAVESYPVLTMVGSEPSYGKCRMAMQHRFVACGMILAGLLAGSTIGAAEQAPAFEAVPTFECVGLYWSPPGGGDAVAARVEYRAKGQGEWKSAQDLWYDGRAQGGRPAEYRGSIVNLKSATSYEVKLTLATGASEIRPFATWSDAFPIAKTIRVSDSNAPLEIDNVHGSPTGYILYTGPATIDVNNAAQCNIRVQNSDYVIIRGLKLTGAQRNGILLGAGMKENGSSVHDVVIENNDISNWGTVCPGNPNNWGYHDDAGIRSDTTGLARLIIQRNRIHNPRTNTNSWKENNPFYGADSDSHPEGPLGINVAFSQGNHVIRYNEVYGDDQHRFEDGMGEDQNFSFRGFPNRDSDIYGNYVAYCRDDGLEIEGADMNVRVWGNYITELYIPFASASVSMGPLYFFRNVACISRTGPGEKYAYGQALHKAGGTLVASRGYYGDGRVYWINNTVLRLPDSKEPQIKGGIIDGDRTLRNYVTRNNIFETVEPNIAYSIHDKAKSASNSFDYDLYNGQLEGVAGSESHGIVGSPSYVPGVGFDLKTMTGNFALDTRSLGREKGAVVPNFTDGYGGAAPDMGAHETGTPLMQFGVNAYLPRKEP